jgi:DNA-binding response OmpR family regulator
LFKILLAEDEHNLRHLLKQILEHEGYQVIAVDNGEEALNQFYHSHFDLVILDWMMPKYDGIEVAQQMKKEYPIKIIMLTAKNMPDDEINAIISGIDDYLTKPFHAKLLFTRISKVLGTLSTFNNERLCFYSDDYKVTLDNHPLLLTRKEYDLLHYFYINKNVTLTREQILASVWGMENENDERTVDSFIRILREKLGKEWIKTIYGIGYQFELQKK